jgi:hypothetical protein
MQLHSFALALLLVGGPTPAASTLYVPADYPTIQAAITASQNGDRILVAPGTYYENDINFQGKAIQLIGVEGRDKTVIDALGFGRIISFDHFEVASTLVQGFTLRNGAATDGLDGLAGKPGLIGHDGGAIYIFGSAPTIRSCAFLNNRAGSGGRGGDSAPGTPGTSSHPAGGDGGPGWPGGRGGNGGAIAIHAGSPVIENCIFSGNESGQGGAGSAGGAGGNGYVAFPTIGAGGNGGVGGTGGDGGLGGAIFSMSSWTEVRSSLFFDNVASAHGLGGPGGVPGSGLPSGVPGLGGAAGAAGTGGGLHLDNGGDSVVGCTVVDNDAWGGGGGVFITAGFLRSTILRSNWPDQHVGLVTASYCNIEGGFAGTGNMDVDPQFVDAPNRDYHLQVSSPCVGAGDPAASFQGPLDMDGEPRVEGLRCDIGADEVYPDLIGTGEDLELVATTNGVWTLNPHFGLLAVDDQLLVKTDSPNSTFLFAPVLLGMQAFPTGGTLVGTPGLPGVLLDGSVPGIFLTDFGPSPFGAALLPPGGVTLAFLVHPALVGSTVRVQSYVISPLASNGIYAASNAVDLAVY